jgi:dimethylargininase
MVPKNGDIRTAIVRDVPDTFDRAIRPPDSTGAIDVELARRQHIAYAGAIAASGVDVVRVPADDRFPDCCFVEDPVFVVGEGAIVCNMAAESRQGEAAAVAEVVSRYRSLETITAPATMDGGDVIVVDETVYIGHSQRTNEAGIEALREMLVPAGVEVVAVTVRGVLHLKSACTYVGNGVLLAARQHVDLSVFRGLRVIDVPAGEAYAANCLSVNGRVVAADGHPETHERIRAAGFDVVALDMSEFRKAGGSLTCLSILL